MVVMVSMAEASPTLTVAVSLGSGRAAAPAERARLSLHALPQWLAGWHARLATGTAIACTLQAERADGSTAAGSGGRWDRILLHDVFDGAGFADIVLRPRHGVLTVRATRRRTLADRVGPDLRLLVCGLNPSLYAADAGVAFARPGNRFWPALLGAGLARRDRDPDDALREHGIGFTDLVKRATRSADEVQPDEFRLGAERVARLVGWLQPGVVCFFGVTGYRAGVDRRARAGVLPDGFAGRPAVLLGNPSGLNAHCRLEELTDALRAAVEPARDAPYGPA